MRAWEVHTQLLNNGENCAVCRQPYNGPCMECEPDNDEESGKYIYLP
jgi:hypothetical protein